jgi:tetratricopeptide (TPR) repeat protein
MFIRSLGCRFFALMLACLLSCSVVRAWDNSKPDDNNAESDRIAKLIEQLGSNDFGVREKAQSELAQAGLEAYDALHAAQNRKDPEIALRARYLVRSMSVRWFAETDSPRVVAILKDYGDLHEADRRSRIDRLKALNNRLGIRPLIRLARFESLDRLAKYAALQIIEAGPPADDATRSEFTKDVTAIVGNSQRASAQWLRLYAKTLSDPTVTLADWEKAITAEHELLEKNADATSREIVRDLYRHQVDRLQGASHSDAATATIRRMFALSDGSPDQLQELVDWLLHRRAWALGLELLQKHDASVVDNPRLLYRLAAIHQSLGDPNKAAETAAQALAIRPENFNDHLVIGHELEDVPLLAPWAEAEYRQVIASVMPGQRADFTARFSLSELLHDRLKELSAAETLQPICDLMKKDENARNTCEQAGRVPEGVFARMHYFYACHFHEQQDWAKEKENLSQAAEIYPKDADVLIALYRLPEADAAWQKMAKEKIEEVTAEYRREVDQGKLDLDTSDGDESRSGALKSYAVDCNQYAWLVGNTFGNHAEAVRLSLESVRICGLLPEMKNSTAGFLDTLGRAYYGAGDIASAVKHQAQAVELNPVSGQIRRQLDFFMKEAKDKGVALPAADSERATK